MAWGLIPKPVLLGQAVVSAPCGEVSAKLPSPPWDVGCAEGLGKQASPRAGEWKVGLQDKTTCDCQFHGLQLILFNVLVLFSFCKLLCTHDSALTFAYKCLILDLAL